MMGQERFPQVYPDGLQRPRQSAPLLRKGTGERRFVAIFLTVVMLMLAGVAGGGLYIRAYLQSLGTLDVEPYEPTVEDEARSYAWNVLLPARESQRLLDEDWQAIQEAVRRGDLVGIDARLLEARSVASNASELAQQAYVPPFLDRVHGGLLGFYATVSTVLDDAESCIDAGGHASAPSCARALHGWQDAQSHAHGLANAFHAAHHGALVS